MGAQYDSLGNYTGYTNDDGTAWSGFGESSLSPTSVRPDLLPQVYQEARARMLQLNNDPAYKQFTPEQAQTYLNFQGGPENLAAYARSISPFEKFGIYSDQSSGGNNIWFGPEAAPQHNDTGPEQIQTAWNDMKNGALIASLPFAWMGATAALGAGAAGAGGATAAEGGAAATGVDASTGLFAGESATSGAAGATEGGVLSGSTGSASLVGDAGSDAAAADTAGFDPGGEGMYNVPTNSSNTIFPNGMDATDPSILQRAQDMAKQLGITPASALGLLKNALTKGAPAVLGAIGANQQANSLSDLAKQYMDLGAPSRARYEASFAPGFTMANDPGYQGALDQSAKATLHGLSVNGNPAGSPNAWNRSLQDLYDKTAYPALQNFRNTNANAGGIATLQTAAPAAATGAINAQSNIFNAVGAGANDIFNPQPSLAQTMAEYQRLIKQGSGAVT